MPPPGTIADDRERSTFTTWTRSSRGRRVATGYLVLQAVLGLAWWTALITSASVREHFELIADRPAGLDAFLVADMLVFVGGSFAAAGSIWWRPRWATLIAAFAAGGTAYATLYLLEWVRLEGTASVGLIPMGVASIATTLIALGTVGAIGPSGSRRDDG